jgi:hypothetical protein
MWKKKKFFVAVFFMQFEYTCIRNVLKGKSNLASLKIIILQEAKLIC